MPFPTPSAREIFLDAIEIEDPSARAAFLTSACAGDALLRRRVEALITAHERPERLLDHPAQADADLIPEIAATPGTMIGPYRLLEILGEGGMGVVYRAEQTEPVRREVAVKVIKPGMDSAQVIARFEAERQALALMDHPNIARVLDAGTTPEGRPYFVMQLVAGVPITAYCDQNRLAPRQRLELFLPVCAAVQHAHQKGVIHRDIKPSNVLVSVIDDRALPRIIDFGIAKAIDQRLTARTLLTQCGAIIGTPEYMSPEQAGPSPQDIDTRSDVYGLGVLLYELLTGTTPLERHGMQHAAVDEVLKRVREEEPPKPSARLLGCGERLPEVAAARNTDPARLARMVDGDLDWIVMKALENDRNRRYETAAELARDIQRHLDGNPVEAGPPSVSYRLHKFARRNRVLLMSVSLIGLTLIVSLGLAISQATLATRAREQTASALELAKRRHAESEAQRKLARRAVDEMYTEVAERWLAERPKATPLQLEFLKKALRFYEGFAREPAAGPDAQRAAAEAFARVGDLSAKLRRHNEAETAYRNAIARLHEAQGSARPTAEHIHILANATLKLANLLQSLGRMPEAEKLYGEVIELSARLPSGPSDPADYQKIHADGLASVGFVLAQQGRAKEAEAYYHRAKPLYEELTRATTSRESIRMNFAKLLNNMGLLCFNTGRLVDAEAHGRRAVDLTETLVRQFPDRSEYRETLSYSWGNLSSALWKLGRIDDAEAGYRQSIASQERLIQDFPDMPDYRDEQAASYGNLAAMLRSAGRKSDAEAALGKAITTLEALAAQFPNVPDYRHHLALFLANRGNLEAQSERYGAVVSSYRRSLALLDDLSSHGPDRRNYRMDRAVARNRLIRILASCPDPLVRKPDAALRLARQAVADDPELGALWGALGLAHYHAGEWKLAVEALEGALKRRPEDPPSGFVLALSHRQLGHEREARQWYEKAAAWMSAKGLRDPESVRYRSEAAHVLGISDRADSGR